MDRLQSCRTLPWRERSPDLSPIEHIWDVTLENGTCPDEMEELFHNMQNLVEETVKSENKKAVIVCHSLGCPVFLTLLGQVSQEWKDKHIEVFVAIGAPWEGAVESLEAVISGVDFGQSVIKPKIVRELFRTMPSLYYLMPFGKLWGSKEVLVETKQKSYTSKDLLKLMVDLGSDGGNFAHLFLDAVTTRKKLGVPGVKTVCYHATGSATPARSLEIDLIYQRVVLDGEVKYSTGFKQRYSLHIRWIFGHDLEDNALAIMASAKTRISLFAIEEDLLVYHGTEGLNGDHEVINEDGDGTVNTRNIEVCRGWVGPPETARVHPRDPRSRPPCDDRGLQYY
ncbi:PLA2G15 [Cordylochernes scorpioides]|uniref:PLA2G15 n=1 Tax=Cordylochernes scorpioides TaxID=51811 RepID=A0ABY6KC75_9ARAC|nr:PLA2G15 [Cordylochernes scorpioides]